MFGNSNGFPWTAIVFVSLCTPVLMGLHSLSVVLWRSAESSHICCCHLGSGPLCHCFKDMKQKKKCTLGIEPGKLAYLVMYSFRTPTVLFLEASNLLYKLLEVSLWNQIFCMVSPVLCVCVHRMHACGNNGNISSDNYLAFIMFAAEYSNQGRRWCRCSEWRLHSHQVWRGLYTISISHRKGWTWGEPCIQMFLCMFSLYVSLYKTFLILC